MGRILIVGATSAISRAIASELASQGRSLILAARDAEELRRIAADLKVRHHADIVTVLLEATDYSSHAALVEACIERKEPLEGVVMALGLLGAQPADSHNADSARRLIEVNLTAPVSLLAPLATHLEEAGSGFILGVSSVAGDRGRQSNYVYGAAKGGFSLYLQGLRNRLEPSGVRVYTVKPGFVDTAMTYGLPGLFLVASPQQLARGCVSLLNKKSGVYYLPFFWRWIMLIIRLIPETIFKRLKL